MSFNGSGTFQINSTGQPVVTGTTISSTVFNALTADLATGLSTCITKDGQTTATARIPFAQGINSSLVTDATSTTTGSIITAGGVGVAKALWVGGLANIAGAVTLQSTLTVATSVTISGLTSGRVPYATTAGLLTDSAAFTFSGTAFAVTGTGSIGFGPSNTAATGTVSIVDRTATTGATLAYVGYDGTNRSATTTQFYVRAGAAQSTTPLVKLFGDNSTDASATISIDDGGGRLLALTGPNAAGNSFIGTASGHALYLGVNATRYLGITTGGLTQTLSTGIYGFTSGAVTAAADTAISRISAGVLGVGTGAAGSVAGSLKAAGGTFSGGLSIGSNSPSSGTLTFPNGSTINEPGGTTLNIKPNNDTVSSFTSSANVRQLTTTGGSSQAGTPITKVVAGSAQVGGNLVSGWYQSDGTTVIATLQYNGVLNIGSVTSTSSNFNLSSTGLTVSANASASTPPGLLSGTWFSGGTATTTKPQLLIEPTGTTSTGWSTSGTGLGVNAASGFVGNLLDLQVNGSLVYKVSYTGATTLANNVAIGWKDSGGTARRSLLVSSTDQVSIGTIDAGWGSNMLITSGATIAMYVNGASAFTQSLTLSTAGALQLNTYGAGTLTTDASGNVTATSDERLKSNIVAYGTGLTAIRAINPIRFNWSTESGNSVADDNIGFSGQNVQAAIPQATGKMAMPLERFKNADRANAKKLAADPTKAEVLTLNHAPILAALVNAVKELDTRLTAIGG